MIHVTEEADGSYIAEDDDYPGWVGFGNTAQEAVDEMRFLIQECCS